MFKVVDGNESRVNIDDVVRDGAHTMLISAPEAEVESYVSAARDERDENGHRLVVRNGYGQERSVVTGAGGIKL